MPAKKSQNEDKKNPSQRGKKGGQSSQVNRKGKKDMDNTVEYIEVDEFTLDDLPKSRS